MSTIRNIGLWVTVGRLTTAGFCREAQATERRFTYTYGSDVLNAGALELEPWTTARVGRSTFYSRMDHRLEFEAGLTDRVQTAWYLNFSAVNRREGPGRVQEFRWQGVSWEWKFKLLDPVADPVGLALYLEPGFGPAEGELEAKVIVDQRIGNFYTAFNAVGEYEAEFATPELEHEMILEFDLGAAYFVTPALALGVEVRSHSVGEVGEGFQHSALFAGPVVSYAAPKWWTAFTLLPQVAAVHGATDHGLDLDEHERVEARMLFGMHL